MQRQRRRVAELVAGAGVGAVALSDCRPIEITVLCGVHLYHIYAPYSKIIQLFGVPVFCILLSYLKAFKEVFPSVYLRCHPLLKPNDSLSLISKRWSSEDFGLIYFSIIKSSTI
jgi:hypothetical protein